MMAEGRIERQLDFDWPATRDVPYEILAAKILELCRELNRREAEGRAHDLETARRLWPTLRDALREKGKVIGLNGFAEPILPDWALGRGPVVCIGESPRKRIRTRAEAWEHVRRNGDEGWATLGELWLWLADAGPIMERGMRKHGYRAPNVGA